MIICTVTTSSHLYRAKVLAASAKKHHPHAKIIVCLIEKQIQAADRLDLYFNKVVLANELNVSNFHEYMIQRRVHEACYALKGHFIEYLFKHYPEETDIIMLDTDVRVYGPLTEALDALDRHPIVLTPHEINDAKESYLFHGIYNIGFIALRRSDEAGRFLGWWNRRVDRYGFDSYHERGIFYEQNWLNLAPALFDVYSLNHLGYNVAFWNLEERGKLIVSKGNGQYLVGNVPLRFFHFSHATHSLPAFIKRYIPKKNKAMYRLHADYLKEIRKMGLLKKGPGWSFDFHDNGEPITSNDRERFLLKELSLPIASDDSFSSANDNSSKRRLKIVQIISNAPFAHPLPPINQGGTEKVVYDLTEELVKQGHEVYLYAAKGSRSSAKVIHYPAGLSEHSIGQFIERTLPDHVDIIHDHTFNSVMGKRKVRIPTVCTHHIPVNNGISHPIYVSERALRVIGKNIGDYVYNGINPEEYEFSKEKKDYLLFIGRLIKEKGVIHAIEVAEKTDMPLVIAGPIKSKDFFYREIMPRVERNPKISYVGAVGGSQKQKLLKHAKWMLFPSTWEEPFGLTMVEAMACGTPVLALNNGAVPEVMAGYPQLICQSVEEMAQKARHQQPPLPLDLRNYVLSRFSNDRMAQSYIKHYQNAISLAKTEVDNNIPERSSDVQTRTNKTMIRKKRIQLNRGKTGRKIVRKRLQRRSRLKKQLNRRSAVRTVNKR